MKQGYGGRISCFFGSLEIMSVFSRLIYRLYHCVCTMFPSKVRNSFGLVRCGCL
ncbi:hypothetical protein BDQ17DRAFT_1362229 [Cyathus striatus]|nr:hypothetical protein BDQ17DRAFT_1362229 [Cyathus striatus]